ncbi:DNA replication licensing factor mcm8 [Gonapodya sp. JEL0774]|nr:DNA replication licensing factor mcm8 [Gonapodya sp. JEL0774]
MERLQRLFGQGGMGGMGGGMGAIPTDTPTVDTAEMVHISSLALLKVRSLAQFSWLMLKHGRAGVPMEVMGLMLGEFVDDYTVRVIDVFAMPQSGTGVSVEAVDPVFQTKMLDMLKQTGRPEMVVGWYHSHPGFGCWLSSVDINTQQSFEALNQRAVAVVVDPIQSVKGKVVIDAFRLIQPQTAMLGQEPRQTTSNIGHLNKPSVQALIHGLNRHYYSIAINYRKNALEQQMLMNLHKKNWTHGLTVTDFSVHSDFNEKQVKQMLALAELYNKSVQEEMTLTQEQLKTRHVGKQDPKRHLEENVEKVMTANIVQAMASMLDTVSNSEFVLTPLLLLSCWTLLHGMMAIKRSEHAAAQPARMELTAVAEELYSVSNFSEAALRLHDLLMKAGDRPRMNTQRFRISGDKEKEMFVGKLLGNVGRSRMFNQDFVIMKSKAPSALLAYLSARLSSDCLERGLLAQTVLVVRILNYHPVTPLRDLKANQVGKFISVQGTVVRVSSSKVVLKQAAFACTQCNEEQVLFYPNGKTQMPIKCVTYGCRSKLFRLNRVAMEKTISRDTQVVRLQEAQERIKGDASRVPRTLEVELWDDLVDVPTPGDVVIVAGEVKDVHTDEGKLDVVATWILVFLSSLTVDDNANPGVEAIFFSDKDLYAMENIAMQPNVFQLIVNSLCPAIFGHEVVKAGLLLTLFGGRKRRPAEGDKVPMRSDPHILIVGDPGLGKSQMLSATVCVAPRGVYVAGNAVTTSGLTVTITREKDTGDFALEAGALVLADQGCCCIDEFDKMMEHSALLEAMEQQSISVAKAGIVCNLPARTSVIAAANPVGGHYNKSKSVAENIKMDAALLSRFDLIFILLDKPDQDMDKFLTDHVFKRVKLEDSKSNVRAWDTKMTSKDGLWGDDDLPLSERLKVSRGEEFQPIPMGLLRKYIAYARMYVNPCLSAEAAQILQDFYMTLRSKYRSSDSTPITTRQLESLVRLGEARARLELRETVTAQDAKEVVEIMRHSLFACYEDELDEFVDKLNTHGYLIKKPGRLYELTTAF